MKKLILIVGVFSIVAILVVTSEKVGHNDAYVEAEQTREDPASIEKTLASSGNIVKAEENCILVKKEALVRAWFTDEFIEKYKYEDSKNYKFALNINGWYYNVYRNENNGVSNSEKDGLTGAIPAYMFDISTGNERPVTWVIPMNTEVKVANKPGTYGYTYQVFTGIDSVRLSPTKETSDIANIRTGYNWGYDCE